MEYPHEWYGLFNEALITRARDLLAHEFLSRSFRLLLMIDADVDFTPEDVGRLINLVQNGADIAAGACPFKRVGGILNVYRGGEHVRTSDLSGFNGPIEVDFVGTAFMMIKREVFEKMRETYPEWQHEEHGQDIYGFFQDPLEGEEKKIRLSEDYFLCRRARELGFSIMLDPEIRLGHWGMQRFDGT